MTYTPGQGHTHIPGYLTVGDTSRALCLGGPAVVFTAGAALTVGQAVYLSGVRTVSAGATANKAKRIGVVVGGSASGWRCAPEIAVGAPAAASGGLVLVAVSGAVVNAIANGALTAGDALVFGATAGRVNIATAVSATAANPTQATTTQANSTIPSGSTPVTSSAANGAIVTAGAITNGAITAGAITLAGDGYRNILGIALTTVSSNGDTVIVLLT